MRKLKPFDLREVIKKRVDIEAELEYPFVPMELPRYTPPKKIDLNAAGVINFCKTILYELAP